MASLMDQRLDMDKLSYEIFSILESKFLFSDSPLKVPLTSSSGKVRILSIDSAADGGVLAALSLSRLETLLKKQSSDPSASVADYFDVAAGSGTGGVLAAMLFTRGQDGRPLFTAEESFKFLAKTQKIFRKSGKFRELFRSKSSNKFRKLFGDACLRQDSIKPLLISCFDLLTGSAFMFSRSDAVESDGFNFLIKDVCAATCAYRATEVKSVDKRTGIKAVGGGIGMGNPTAAAITHVLNNKREFPFADGAEDLLVVSLGSSEAPNLCGEVKSAAKIARIAGEGTIDAVDQSVAMAFGQNSSSYYVRIQANGIVSETKAETQTPVSAAETALSQRCIESVMFKGKKIWEQSNGERIEWASSELIKEEDRRKKSSVPTVMIKPAAATPRTSSATTATTATVTSTATSASLC